MILDAIILENFGVYRGRQEAILTPEPGKPIILFCGMNGSGKTTLFDALQLALYGQKARLSNRGRRTYNEYLRESIHRGVDPGEGASVTLRFRRYIEGQARQYEVKRSWREGVKGVEENMHVFCDGLPDPILTEHWSETMENYLPSSLAHLFFFDGEQIKELAEGGKAAQILGTAIHSLLGLNLVDRLEMDIKALKHRHTSAISNLESNSKLKQVQTELAQLNHELEQISLDESHLNNEADWMGEVAQDKEDRYVSEGGNIFERHNALKKELATHNARKEELEAQLRELIAGPLPLVLVRNLLAEVEAQTRRENQIRRCRVLLEELHQRDCSLIRAMQQRNVDLDLLKILKNLLNKDRLNRTEMANEVLLLDADEEMPSRLAYLRTVILPAAEEKANYYKNELLGLEERIVRIQEQLDRAPPYERIRFLQVEMDTAKNAHTITLDRVRQLCNRKEALEKQRMNLDHCLDSLELELHEANRFEDGRLHLLQHIRKVRNTLTVLRNRVVVSHSGTVERLMLDSLHCLLHKNNLIKELKIDPSNFEASLTGQDGTAFPSDRLSAGESQILATALIWGLARASGRAVPTIIDTPLGRLDARHRQHIIERYFPHAGHQVLLLSTDTEIGSRELQKIQKYLSKTYILEYDLSGKCIKITKGNFKHEKAN